MKILFIFTTISLVSFNLLIYEHKRVNAQESSCFMVNNSGQFIDLTHVCNGEKVQTYSVKEQLLRAIKKLNVSVSHKNCEPQTLGSYLPGENQVILCKNNIDGGEQYLRTLAHESWHIVQDCVGNLDDGIIVPVTASNTSKFQSLLNSLSDSDLTNLRLYNSEELPYEVEAFAMEKHPNLVLKGLQACASQQLASK